ncbi:PhzF family phenazine biosynthesis protein [Tissierella sp. Yu-01]|uniref:PhzF family phenazine biosynthesis protein n=1 Tax=Tissierella sp. Yu-01 TaxID=3035694 RepID=UPI00240D7458|nr:PhzF family phenazine biosynthesis protein [Tissierella sp. Yu-01]WFA08306.1 PhzF family phenazine biosynthesis protein [Tissierella sp. Yu-01]
MEVNIFQVDAFSSKPFGGNPAIVVPNAKRIKEQDMQKIANEMNVSETAFVHQLDDDIFRVKFFTPVCEIDLCGHATIATFYTMANKGYIKPIYNGTKIATLVTNVGKLPVELHYKNGQVEYILMQQNQIKSCGLDMNIDDILDIMNLRDEHIGINDEFYAPEIISTGLQDLIIPIREKYKLDNINVDFCSLSAACRKLNITRVHVFNLPKRNSDVVYARNFAPLVGIDEEPATGTASGALIYYLKKNDLISSNMITSLQGDSLKRPSKIYCFIEEDGDDYKVKVGGNANIVMEGILKY